jgi:hypothetical protein
LLQSGLPQNRLPSGTCGSVIIAAAGSPLGMRGMATIPAPSLPRELVDFDEPVRAVRAERADRAEPLRAVAAGSCAPVAAAGSCAPAAGAVPQTSQ